MRTKTRTGTRFKPMRIVWRDSAPRLSKSDRKMLVEKKESIEDEVKENLPSPLSLF